MRYVVLEGTKVNGDDKRVLVEIGTFVADGAVPGDYFTGASNIEKVGEVDIIGDLRIMDEMYETC